MFFTIFHAYFHCNSTISSNLSQVTNVTKERFDGYKARSMATSTFTTYRRHSQCQSNPDEHTQTFITDSLVYLKIRNILPPLWMHKCEIRTIYQTRSLKPVSMCAKSVLCFHQNIHATYRIIQPWRKPSVYHLWLTAWFRIELIKAI